ncbi:hypothetical protein SAMN04488030_3341 [Aliiroseovarius halocynthiae]|uniref:Uncharacterized protein n=1 Tax=Aliiroseovarius halocynthiae TaxID=985055 RepID=A0A545SLT9_9RHOB|nr:hypothetical protein [Aliiroseovarius halocynthiae]TQV65945.1 hypothetical protein FIL88_15780 [Aliiroseovarius halocynthiae]SMR83422.1 hypothetical protein SAMN04488030_3341 [Aliiroseovarius halocynthiae]
MKRSAKIVATLTSTIAALAIMLIVTERNHCPLKDYLPQDAEMVSCEYYGGKDFSTMIKASGPSSIQDEFEDRILESNPELQFIATGYVWWSDGTTVMEKSDGPAPFNIYSEHPDQRLAIGYQDGILTVIDERW